MGTLLDGQQTLERRDSTRPSTSVMRGSSFCAVPRVPWPIARFKAQEAGRFAQKDPRVQIRYASLLTSSVRCGALRASTDGKRP